MSYKILRNVLFLIPPESAHRIALESLRVARSLHLHPGYGSDGEGHSLESLGLVFPNRVGLAAGYDKNGDYIDALGALGFGFIEIGTVTPKPQPGNPRPRVFRIPSDEALINRMGSPNKGIEHVVRRIKVRQYKGILGVNIGKNTDTPKESAADDYLTCYRAVAQFADYVVLNVSSPNTPGLRELQADTELRCILMPIVELRDDMDKPTPVLVKISPDLPIEELNHLSDTIAEIGIDGVIATNTTTSRAGLSRSHSQLGLGGLSGRPLHRKSLNVIQTLRHRLGEKFTIIGLGGIMSSNQALDTFNAGADLVQIFSGLIYRGPKLIREIVGATL